MRDTIVSGVIIALSVFFFSQTFIIETIAGFERVSPRFWPRFNLAVIIILSLINIGRSILKRPKGKSKPATTAKTNRRMVMICWGVFCAYVALIPYLGFLLSSFLGTATLIFALGERKKVSILVSALVLVAVVYLVFGKLMYVPMPRGVSIFQQFSKFLY